MKTFEKKYEKGEYLLHQNELSRHMFLIKSGKVRVIREESGRIVYMREIGPGGIVGEISLIDGEPRSASAIAAELVETTIIPPDEFDDVSKALPQWLSALSKAIAFRIRSVLSKLQHSPDYHIKKSIVSLIVYMTAGKGGRKEFSRANLTQELSEMLSVDIHLVDTYLDELSEKGIIHMEQDKISIEDFKKLEAFNISQKKEVEKEHIRALHPE